MQTALDFFFKELRLWYGSTEKLDLLYKEAKQLEKQQIIDAYEQGSHDEIVAYDGTRKFKHSSEYFAETYGSKGSDKEEQKKLITEIMNEDAKDGLYTEINWGGVVQHIPNMCNCHQSNCHLINGKYICATCNKTLNVETQHITSSQTEISDEEIDKLGDDYYNKLLQRRESALNYTGQVAGRHPDLFGNSEMLHMVRGFEECLKWYREQLKKK